MIYVVDEKKNTVRGYYTTPKVEKAIETLLKQDDELVHYETHEGYTIDIVESKKGD